MTRRLVVGVAMLVLLVGAVGLAGGTEGAGQEFEPLVQNGEEFDRTVFEVTVFADGDARWTLEQQRQIPLDDQDAIDSFEAFAEEFTTNETEAYRNFQIRAQRLTAQGSNVTDREMVATDFRRDAYYEDRLQRGVVEMSFRWENFAPADGEEVIVADVLAGFAIFEEQQLAIVTGGSLTVRSVTPEPDQRSVDGQNRTTTVRWRGPEDFENSLEVIVGPPTSDDPPGANSSDPGSDDGPQSDSSGDSTGNTADTGDSGGSQSGMMMPVLVAFLLMLSVGGGAVWYTLSRASSENEPAGTATAETTESPSVEGESAAVSEQELLSDEDLVLELLEENGGRMRQVSIVEETDWSKSKVSMLLSDMEDEGDISKLRVGRENIISLAGEEPEAAGSPFEAEDED